MLLLLFNIWLFGLLSQSLVNSATIEYDYIIVGGGTAGLTIAARLTENSKITVLVLEAGGDQSQDVNVLAPGLAPVLYGNATYDWNFHTTPQIHAAGQGIAQPRGRQLGGSSAINLLFWTHAGREDIDNWGRLGNEGWSWKALAPFFRRSEHFVAPDAKVRRQLQTQYINPALHGTTGPVFNEFPVLYGPLDIAWPRTYEALGLAVKADPRAGVALGGYTNLVSIKPQGSSRSYAATTYLAAARARPNLIVKTGALVENLVIYVSNTLPQERIAKGVHFRTSTNNATIYARREIILCAGSIGSPHILELSGIGNPALLEKYGIRAIYNNTNVGENLQDHPYVPIGYRVNKGIPTLDDLNNATIFEEALKQYEQNQTGILSTTSASSALLSFQQIGGDPSKVQGPDPNPSSIGPGYPDQYKILLEQLFDPKSAVTQELSIDGGISPQFSNDTTKLFVASVPGNFFTLLGTLEHPFSRGSVHLQSADPTAYPLIDPNYLSNPRDLQILSQIALHLQKVASTPPLANLLQGNGSVYQPGYHALTPSNVEDWVRRSLQSEYHPAGTCQMAPRNKGGVVDARFNVYGISNLRVVDASVFPLLPRADLQTLVYAVAERAAEWIKMDGKAGRK